MTFQCPNAVGGWRIDTISVEVLGSVPIPQVSVYLAGQLLAVKRAGDRGVLLGEGEVVHMGQLLTLTWEDADPGALAEATVVGELL